jgi:stage II sporulation protein D
MYPAPPLVRVALVVGSAAQDLVVAMEGPYDVVDGGTGRVYASAPRLPLTGIAAGARGLRLGEQNFPANSLRLRPRVGEPFRLNGNPYAGDLLCFRAGDAVTLVNELDVESYVAGVLGAEMPLTFVDEALKAQAVAARTYVLYEAKTAGTSSYDVVATEASQVYKGLSVASGRARRLVRATEGVIATVDGRVFPTYFHSTCGGHTTDVSAAWSGAGLRPLSGVPCGFCTASPQYQWVVEVAAEEVARSLAERGLFSGAVTNVTVTRRGTGGYATEVEVTGPGKRTRMGAYAFRLAVGAHRVKSTNFEVTPTAGGFLFQGRGFGHGVGLCQWGAEGMAQAGWNYREILAHYYAGARLVRIYR